MYSLVSSKHGEKVYGFIVCPRPFPVFLCAGSPEEAVEEFENRKRTYIMDGFADAMEDEEYGGEVFLLGGAE